MLLANFFWQFKHYNRVFWYRSIKRFSNFQYGNWLCRTGWFKLVILFQVEWKIRIGFFFLRQFFWVQLRLVKHTTDLHGEFSSDSDLLHQSLYFMVS